MTATTNDGFTQTTATGGETTIDFDFLIYGKDDIAFYETDTSGVIALLVRGTDYSIADSELNDPTGGEIVLDVGQYPSGATAGHKFTCISDIGETRAADFQQGGDFFAQTLNTNLDRLTRVTQQLRRDVDKAARLKVDSLVASVTFTDDPQDGYGIVWDGVLGNFRNTASSIAVLEGNAAIVAANIASVNTVATNIANVNTVAGISANVTTVAGIAAAVTTVAGIAAAVSAVAAVDTEVTTVAGISADVTTVAGISAAVSAVAAIDTAVSAVAAIDSDVTTVAGVASEIATLAPISADISAVAAIDSDVTTVAGIAAAISTVAAIADDVTAAANNIPKANRTATAAPTVNDDSGDGYSEGSLWVNVNTNTIYFCADPAPGAAVWQSVAGSLSGMADVTLTTPAAGNLLTYNGSVWVNGGDFKATNITAEGSSGLVLKDNSGVTIATLGAGGGTGVTFAGVINAGSINSLTTDLSVANGGTGASDAATARANLGVINSKILQVQSTTKTDTYTNGATGYNDITGLSVTITPTSASSTILVLAVVNGSVNTATDNGGQVQLVRDSTAIAIGAAAGSRTRASAYLGVLNTNTMAAASISHVDSPATTSAVTYKLQGRPSNGGDFHCNRSNADSDSDVQTRTASYIIAIEIGA